MYDYKGCIHLHSKYSDGHRTVDEIMAAANECGLDYVVLTDHDTTQPHDDGHEKWHGSALLITGIEITPPTNHYIVFGEGKLKGVDQLRLGPRQPAIDAVREAGWLGFIAHPDHVGTERFQIPPYRWEDWAVTGYTGMGLWDLMTDFQCVAQDAAGPEVYENFAKHLTGPRPETMARFDELNAKAKVVGIGEIDNHDKPYPFGDREFRIFPYAWAFRTITNHVLLAQPLDRDYAKAKRQILDAIRAGRCYVAFEWDADPSEFSFEVEEIDRTAGMGDSFEIDEVARAIVTLPEPARIRVVHNGQVVHEEDGADEAIVELETPGPVRVEARRDGRPWIYSNPIHLTAKA